ncbi:MAG: DUF2130 domain-containing protein [Saprospirales bacterium]|nr:MAG: DUF2130 domain-containing protein [Saprospirales bacterium]
MSLSIECPHCHEIFTAEEALSGKLEAHYKTIFDRKLDEQTLLLQKEKDQLARERLILQELKNKEEELLSEKLRQALIKEKKELESSLLERYQQEMQVLREQNEKKSKENSLLKEKELKLLKQEAELKAEKQELSYNMEKKLIEKQSEIEEKARAKERENFEFEKLKLLKQIEDNKKLAEEMKRKAEQGSMEMQGEIQEIALEELLTRTFSIDVVKEVPKGTRGADVIQTVFNEARQECGSIVYESKRTKNFSNDWIEKIKQDQLSCRADVAVIVTETMPREMEKFGEKQGVWICSFQEVKSLSFVLREMIIKTQSVKISQENKGDKMELLYTYLTSNEFVQNVKRIIEIYDNMLKQLNSEKRAMNKIWAQREKQVWSVQENLSTLFGSIKGIAGSEFDASNLLELTTVEED